MTAAAADFLAVLLVSTFLVATLFTARLRRDLFVPPGDLLLLFCFSAPCLRSVHSNLASSPPQGSGVIVFVGANPNNAAAVKGVCILGHVRGGRSCCL